MFLASPKMTDAGLAHLEGLGRRKLLLIGLAGTEVSDAGLAHLTSTGVDKLRRALPNVRIVVSVTCGSTGKQLKRQRLHQRLILGGETRTITLPKFSPRNSPIKARGAFSRPSTMSSRYLMRPSRTNGPTSARKSGCWLAKSM